MGLKGEGGGSVETVKGAAVTSSTLDLWSYKERKKTIETAEVG